MHFKQAGIIGYGESQIEYLKRLSSRNYDSFDPERKALLEGYSKTLASRFFDVGNYEDARRACAVGSIHDCGVNQRDADGMTGLYRAVNDGDPEQVSRLLDIGADVDVQTHEGRTALMRASYLGDVEMVRILLDSGADPLLQTFKWKYDAALYAAEQGHADVLDLLATKIEIGRAHV